MFTTIFDADKFYMYRSPRKTCTDSCTLSNSEVLPFWKFCQSIFMANSEVYDQVVQKFFFIMASCKMSVDLLWRSLSKKLVWVSYMNSSVVWRARCHDLFARSCLRVCFHTKVLDRTVFSWKWKELLLDKIILMMWLFRNDFCTGARNTIAHTVLILSKPQIAII